MLFVNRYDWIALLDVDELIVPRKHNSWAEMMAEVGPHMPKSTSIDLSIIIFNISR